MAAPWLNADAVDVVNGCLHGVGSVHEVEAEAELAGLFACLVTVRRCLARCWRARWTLRFLFPGICDTPRYVEGVGAVAVLKPYCHRRYVVMYFEA